MDRTLLEKENHRVDYIDFFKGIGIILMVMGHIPFGDRFEHYIHAFHMPMFFFISGWLYKVNRLDFMVFIKKKTKSLLVPYLSFAILGYTLWIIEIQPNNISDFFKPIKSVIWVNTSGMPIVGAIWFLTSLFFVDVVYEVLHRYISRKNFRNVIIVIIVIFGFLVNSVFKFRLPWAIDAGCVGLGFYHIAYTIKENQNRNILKKLLNLKEYEVICGFIISFLLIFVNGEINMRTGDYSFIPLFLVNALCMTIIGWNIAKIALERRQVVIFVSFNKWVINIGRVSIVYLGMNEIIINVIKSILTKIDFYSNLKFILILVLSFITLQICSWVIMKSKLSIFIGKW